MLLILPQEIIHEVLFQSDPMHLIRLVLTCRLISSLVEKDTFWKILCKKLQFKFIQPSNDIPEHFSSYKDWFVAKTNTRLTLLDDFKVSHRPLSEDDMNDLLITRRRFGAFLKMKVEKILFQGNFALFLYYHGQHDLDFYSNIKVNGQNVSTRLHKLQCTDDSTNDKLKLASFSVTSSFSLVSLSIEEFEKRDWVDWTQDTVHFRRVD